MEENTLWLCGKTWYIPWMTILKNLNMNFLKFSLFWTWSHSWAGDAVVALAGSSGEGGGRLPSAADGVLRRFNHSFQVLSVVPVQVQCCGHFCPEFHPWHIRNRVLSALSEGEVPNGFHTAKESRVCCLMVEEDDGSVNCALLAWLFQEMEPYLPITSQAVRFCISGTTVLFWVSIFSKPHCNVELLIITNGDINTNWL